MSYASSPLPTKIMVALMQVTGLVCVQCMCTFHIWLCHFAVVNHGQWVHTLCLSCPGAVWGHQREILPLNQSVLLWCDFQSVSWLLLHRACSNWSFGSFLLWPRRCFIPLHCLCIPPHMSFHWGFGPKLVPTSPSGHALCILLCKFPIPLGRVAELLWPWHMPHRIQALT